jgi:hypothetical protein
MLEEIRYIRRSLSDNFKASTDGYTRKMFRFVAVAEEELKELRDGIIGAEAALREVQTYYGEGEEMGRPIPSQEFFGIFRTFTSSYKVCLPADKAESSSVDLRIGKSKKRILRGTDGPLLELHYHRNPQAHRHPKATSSMPGCNASNLKVHLESSESVVLLLRLYLPYPPTATFPTLCYRPWATSRTMAVWPKRCSTTSSIPVPHYRKISPTSMIPRRLLRAAVFPT